MKVRAYPIGTKLQCIGGPIAIVEGIIIRFGGAVLYEMSYFKDGDLVKLEMDSFLVEPIKHNRGIGYL